MDYPKFIVSNQKEESISIWDNIGYSVRSGSSAGAEYDRGL